MCNNLLTWSEVAFIVAMIFMMLVTTVIAGIAIWRIGR